MSNYKFAITFLLSLFIRPVDGYSSETILNAQTEPGDKTLYRSATPEAMQLKDQTDPTDRSWRDLRLVKSSYPKHKRHGRHHHHARPPCQVTSETELNLEFDFRDELVFLTKKLYESSKTEPLQQNDEID